MNRIESDRMNRTDWIESIEWIESDRMRCTDRLNRKQQSWNDSDLNRIVSPMLGGNKILRLKIVEI